jgi:hypothetical protein
MVLETGGEEGEDVPQGLVPQEHVYVIHKAMFAGDDEDAIGVIPLELHLLLQIEQKERGASESGGKRC